MHFGPDDTRPAEQRLWIAVSHIQAIQPAERAHKMHGIDNKYTYVYTTDSDDKTFSVTETPEQIFKAMED
jgi:hypothetical protein